MKKTLIAAALGVAFVGCVSAPRSPAKPDYATFISHRGESFDAPENTLPAYKMAVDRGFGFECDVYLSKDNRVFTFHDGDLKRTTDGACTLKCSEANWETTISKLDVGNWGKWKGSKFAGTRPALLEEVLELARDGRYIYVEVKGGSTRVVPYIRQIFEKQTQATYDNTLFICFSREVCKALKQEMPDYRVYWLTGGKDATIEYVLEGLKETGADGVDIHFNPKFVTPEFVKTIEAAGYEVHVWTVDNLDRSLEAFANGVRTVTTNCAQRQLDEYHAREAAAK